MLVKLVSLLKSALIVSLIFAFNTGYAEYYVVSDCCSVTEYYSPAKRIHHYPKKYVAKKRTYHSHRMVYKRKSDYHISVYYIWNGFPSPCPSPCYETRCSPCCGGCYQRSSGSIVKFSGAPAAWPRNDFSEGTNNWNYYQDRATADDVYPDMEIND